MFRLLVVVTLLYSVALNAAEKVFDFSDLNAGDAPRGFRNVVGGQGKPAEWKIVLDELPHAFPSVTGKAIPTSRRPVLAQLSRDRTDEHTPMFIYDGDVFGDFKLTTLFKLVDGEVEQMAGIAFGFQDANNYYYVRASALGNTFNFFKIINGQRSPPTGTKVEIPKGAWHELAVECNGNTLRASLNGKALILLREEQPFARGKIGFWTKSDSVSYFAETRVIYTPRENLAQALIRETLHNYPRLQALYIFAPTVGSNEPTLIASSEATEIGKPAPPEVRDVLARSIPY
ncbi:MAG TPA: family 16 glycoside hydrolase, partial [Verrucomicrobiae bacterium]|nr:family 16 glycoside hydrolase [Verrucomicrobiae bacterium]